MGRSWLRAVGSTGELAVMATPQSQQTIDATHSIQSRNEIALRVLFEMIRYKPSAKAHQLMMPVLLCVAEYDRGAPGDLARQIGEQAPRGELKSYPVARFEFYRPDGRAQVVRDQIDFLRRYLMLNQ